MNWIEQTNNYITKLKFTQNYFAEITNIQIDDLMLMLHGIKSPSTEELLAIGELFKKYSMLKTVDSFETFLLSGLIHKLSFKHPDSSAETKRHIKKLLLDFL